ncbi:hypothetical protein V7128_09615 [Neobacillus vireti]
MLQGMNNRRSLLATERINILDYWSPISSIDYPDKSILPVMVVNKDFI